MNITIRRIIILPAVLLVYGCETWYLKWGRNRGWGY